LDDPDGDGANNVVEYGLGTHPRKSASAPRIASRGTGLTYTRRRGTNLVFTVEVSTNLNFNVWHFNGDGSGLAWTTENSVVPVNLDFETVVITPGPALAGASNAFFRVGATLSPQ
jgi:hypothetical protein